VIAPPGATLACVLVAGLAGCTTTIGVPPDPVDPVAVYIVDHGRTGSLVIPASSGGMLRYAYGDWRWYALRETGPLRALLTLFWPTQGALGRAELVGAPTLENLRLHLGNVASVHSVRVERARVTAFERDMETLYDSRRETEVDTPTTGLRFVHHPRRYTYFHNSNHMVAVWLRRLGCTTRGASFHARWRVEAPRQAVTDSG
jgi:hypothetical protein